MIIVDKHSSQMDCVEYSRTEAIREGIILKTEVHFHDPDVIYIDKKGATVKVPSLAELKDETLGSAIWAANRTQAAEDLIFRGLAAFDRRRQIDSTAKAIIMAPSIIEAEKIYKMLLRDNRTSHLAPIIATSDDKQASQNLKTFRTTATNHVLITIEMASEGFDCCEASFLILVTQIRSRVWIEQALARITRVNMHAPHNLSQKAYVYAFADPLMKGVLEEIRNEESTIIVEKDLLQTREGGAEHVDHLGDIVPIASTIRGTTSFELETGLSVNVIQLRKAALDSGIIASEQQLTAMAHQLKSNAPNVVPIPVSVNAQTDALRKRIETKVREIAIAKNKTPKELNQSIKRHYKRSRTEMDVTELTIVWKDLCIWCEKNLASRIVEHS